MIVLYIEDDANVVDAVVLCLQVRSGYATDPIMVDYKKYGFSGVTKPYSAA